VAKELPSFEWGGKHDMKTLVMAFLFASGMLMAAEQPAQQPEPVSHHLSYFARMALRTQSPPVKTYSRKSDKQSKYIVTENKSTIVAQPRFMPNQQ
jgi:hypothetical protein